MACTSPTGTSQPLWPWRTCSRAPPTSVISRGLPSAMASSAASEKVSVVEVMAMASQAATSGRTS